MCRNTPDNDEQRIVVVCRQRAHGTDRSVHVGRRVLPLLRNRHGTGAILLAGVQVVIAKTDDDDDDDYYDYDMQRALCLASTVCKEHNFKSRYYIYSRHTQQSIFTQLSPTSSMATCFGRPCDHHQANFYRSCAFNVLTIWDPIMCT